MSSLISREFRYEDIEQIVTLFNNAFHNYVGFVPRTAEYWSWSSYKRPDVAIDGIRVMTLGKKIVGYIVVGRSGNVWDMCYDSQIAEAETIVYRLHFLGVRLCPKGRQRLYRT